MFEYLKLFSVLIFSFYLLIKSAEYLISSSSKLGEKAGISKFVIGLTLIAIGTSLPEFFTAMISLFSSSNSAAFILGTIIGSNIANILLVFAILLSFSNKFNVHIKMFDIFFFLLSTIAIIYTVFSSQINLYQGILYLLLFISYMYLSVKKGSKKDFENEVKEVEVSSLKKISTLNLSLIFLVSLIGLNLAAKGVIYSIENLGILFSIPLELLTLTTVAFATSLPEIVVTYSAAKKSEFDLAVGNIIGSNISNVFFIIGAVGLIKNVTFISADYFISILILIIATISFVSILLLKKVNRKFGIFFFLIYFVYIFILVKFI